MAMLFTTQSVLDFLTNKADWSGDQVSALMATVPSVINDEGHMIDVIKVRDFIKKEYGDLLKKDFIKWVLYVDFQKEFEGVFEFREPGVTKPKKKGVKFILQDIGQKSF